MIDEAAFVAWPDFVEQGALDDAVGDLRRGDQAGFRLTDDRQPIASGLPGVGSQRPLQTNQMRVGVEIESR